MSAHTPGPWEIEPLEVFGRGDREGTAHIVLWDEDREGYTFVARALSFDDEESVANARLIAAAPQLPMALEDAIAVLQPLAEQLSSVKSRCDGYARIVRLAREG